MLATKQVKLNKYPVWCSRFWHGLRFGDWLSLLAKNRFRIHPLRLPLAVAVSAWTPWNSVFSLVQKILLTHRISSTEIAPPLFILGHWRSGTTYLHELLARDCRFTSPSTLDCFLPHHSLISGWFFTRFGGFMVPSQRPQDNVAAGWWHPQEDEFALMNLGLPSPYLRMAFPNHPPVHTNYLDSQAIPADERADWLDGLEDFVRVVSYRDPGKSVVLKSPTHLGRLEALAERFPTARFVHIIRDPASVFPSTQRLWRSLDLVQGLQIPENRDLDEYVLSNLETMYAAFERQRTSLPDSRICDVRYEDLVADPLREVSRIYQQLELADFAPARPALAQYVESQRNFRGNKHHLQADEQQQIASRWGRFFQPYGYDLD